MKSQSKRHGGQAPYGYQWETGTFVHNPHELPVRRYIYELFLQHKRKKAVARILNQEGYRTRRRAFFSGMTIERILKDPIGKGIWRKGHAKSLGKNQPWISRPEKDWEFEKVPPTVSEDIWDNCQKILNKKETTPTKKSAKHLFRDYIQCHCGARMKVPSQRAKYHCPSCGNSIEQKKVEDIFISQIAPFKIHPNETQKRKLKIQIQNLKSRSIHLTTEATIIQTQLQYLKTTLTNKSEFANKTERLITQLNQIKKTLKNYKDLSLKIENSLQSFSTSNSITLSAKWLHLTYLKKRNIVEKILKIIVVGEQNVKVIFSVSPQNFSGEGSGF